MHISVITLLVIILWRKSDFYKKTVSPDTAITVACFMLSHLAVMQGKSLQYKILEKC